MHTHKDLARLAERQFGVVAAFQLARLGYSTSAISRGVSAGRLHRVHRGVYAVGHAGLSRHGLCAAAVLAGGRGTTLSHRSAAWLWGFLPAFTAPVEVIAPPGRHPRAALRLRRARLASGERARYERIPVTTVPRTLLDLAATLPERRRGSSPERWLASIVDAAKRRGRLDLVAIDELLARRYGQAGTVALRKAVDLYRTPVFDRARSELLFLRLVREAELPQPALNSWVGEFEIDAWWEAERFAVEVDGWEAHGDRRSFEADRLRLEDMRLAGIDAVRVTARRIEREPAEVARRLHLHLERRRRELGV